MGKSNPKSTTGRLDIFTRVITENGKEYDYINYNYKGKLYLEIIPQSFSIILKKYIIKSNKIFSRFKYRK